MKTGYYIRAGDKDALKAALWAARGGWCDWLMIGGLGHGDSWTNVEDKLRDIPAICEVFNIELHLVAYFWRLFQPSIASISDLWDVGYWLESLRVPRQVCAKLGATCWVNFEPHGLPEVERYWKGAGRKYLTNQEMGALYTCARQYFQECPGELSLAPGCWSDQRHPIWFIAGPKTNPAPWKHVLCQRTYFNGPPLLRNLHKTKHCCNVYGMEVVRRPKGNCWLTSEVAGARQQWFGDKPILINPEYDAVEVAKLL